MKKKRRIRSSSTPLNRAVGGYQGKRRKSLDWIWLVLAGLGWAVDLIWVRTLPGARFLFDLLLGFFALVFVYGLLGVCVRAAFRGEKLFRILRRVMEIGFVCWVLSFIVIQFVIASGTKTDMPEEVDYLIVMGAGIKGTRLTDIYYSRLKLAGEYLLEHPGTTVICTGGQGPEEDITEAEAARRYFERIGIPAERILMEDGASTSSAENLRFVQGLIPEGAVVAICTNEFHLYRSRAIARKRGIEAYGLSAPTPSWYYRLVYSFREYFSMVFMLLGRY